MNSIRSSIMMILAFCVVVIGFLFWLIYFSSRPENIVFDVSLLSGLNAILNGCATICLLIGFKNIRQKKIDVHKKWMLAAFLFSSLFLISYLIYHTFHGDTKFMAEGLIRYVYFFILISHIILSVVALPLILISFFLSLTGRISLHRKVSRFTFPLWLYVSVTGVLVYALLKLFN